MYALVRSKAINQSASFLCFVALLLSIVPAFATASAASLVGQSTRRRAATQTRTSTQTDSTKQQAQPSPEKTPLASVPPPPAPVCQEPKPSLIRPYVGQIYYLGTEGDKISVPVSVKVETPDNWQVDSVTIHDGKGGKRAITALAGMPEYSGALPDLGEGFYEYRVETVFKDSKATASPKSFQSELIFSVRNPRPRLRDNGITVGQTKLFDERSLSAKLQELEASLSGLGFVDRAVLAKAIGSLQGARQDVSAFSLNVTGLPIPGIVDKATSANSEKTTATGTETSSSTGSEITNTTSSLTPAAPALPGQTPALSPQLSFGSASQDLLAEQVQLTYQIINLRTLLERAITDRVTANVDEAEQRRPAVVGFQVSLESRNEYRDAVAEVDIKISSVTPVGNPARPNLISLIPKEKTYNVATISKNAKQFGFGAVVQVLNIGASFSRSKDTFYLVRDTDTVATERPAPLAFDQNGQIQPPQEAPGSITFGWQFRPVLGRRAVEPGARSVFALLSLPPNESTTYVARVEVSTRWRKYDAKKGTVGDFIQGSDSLQVLDDLIVRRDIDELLQPAPGNVRWEDTMDGQALVIVNGRNFLPGTGILVGNALLDRPQVGFVLSDEHSLRFTVPVMSLISLADLQIVGRFGSPSALLSDETSIGRNDWGIQPYVVSPQNGDKTPDPVEFKPIDAENTEVSLKLTARQCLNGTTSPCSPEEAFKRKALVLIGRRVFGAGDSPISVYKKDGEKYLTLKFTAPTKLLGETRVMKIKYPFLEPRAFFIEVPFELGNTFGIKNAVVLSSDDKSVQLGIRGSEFDQKKVSVRLGPKEYKESSPEFLWLSKDLIRLNLNMTLKDLARVKNVIVSQDKKNIILPITVDPQPAAKPEVHAADPVAMGDSKVVTLKGANFNSIQEIRFEGRVLAIEVKDDGATLLLSVPSEMTVLPGSKDLLGTLKDGKPFTYQLKVLGR
jgi:hypothetical protein